MSTTTEADRSRQARRAGFAAFLGTSVEWYDFFVFGTASALVLGKLYFPQADPTVGTLAAFATFGAGYLARPLGGIVFGHLGDRVGRKSTLIITLLLMGFATVVIGLLPTYEQIGIAAPVLLVVFRLIQGVAVGGEWGGAVLIASEHAQKKHKVAAGAWAQQGAPAGNLMAAGVFLVVSGLPDDQFLSWGWRLPFLFSAVLVVIGLVVRLKIEEPQEFLVALANKKKAAVPFVEVIRKSFGIVMLGAFAAALSGSYGTFFKVLGLDYATSIVGMDRQSFLLALTVMSAAQFVFQPIAAAIVTRIEPVRVLVCSIILSMALLPVAWVFVTTGSTLLVIVGLVVTIAPIGAQYALIAGYLAEAFPTHVRYTGISLSFQLNSAIFTSMTPLIGGFLIATTGSAWSIIGFQESIAVVSLVGVLLMTRFTGAGTFRAAESEEVGVRGSAQGVTAVTR
ncbi:MFS transporter [Rhodococcus sp. T2V]|uniref:MFS transporter n=1 Tax=Rhodococcus sp. T2V TaxID=3034164 RepID=UPI0023E0C04B|nr:MFS transporter [Rhodococcus sp. T2V]MDF3313102.1 MFS transporter [Rhodococcus sp. T2V]